ncbi:MAG: CPBP family intramembrane glutamic endopeptidase, partial [Chloroflexota bacterium]
MNQPHLPVTEQKAPLPSVPWTPRDVGWGLLIFLLWALAFGVIGLFGEELGLSVDVGVVVVFGEAILLLPVWYFTIHKYSARWANLGLCDFRPAAVGLGCGLMLLSAVFNFIYAVLLGLFDLRVQPDIALIFEQTDFPLLLFFGGAVVAPFVEEIFFRGFIFTGLQRRWSWQRAALASAGL